MADLSAEMRQRAERLGPIGPSEPSTPLVATCIDCKGRGYFVCDVPYGHPDCGKLQQCACRRQTLAQATQATQRAAQSRLLDQLNDELGELADCQFATFDLDRPLVALSDEYTIAKQRETLQMALSAAQRYADAPEGWLYFVGPCGSGKSHLAAAIAHDLVLRDYKVRYASIPLLLKFIRQGMKDGSADERVDALSDVAVLVLDDLGTEQRTAWSDTKLFEIIHARSLQRLPTVLTSNHKIDNLEPRIASRIKGRSRVVRMVVSDYRDELYRQREEDAP